MKELKIMFKPEGGLDFVPAESLPNIFGGANIMPNGTGGWIPVPPVMNKREAILYLRLEQCPNPERTLRYYREKGLRCVQVGKELRFTKEAIDDFLRENLK